MSYHITKSGHVEFVCKWGHGEGSPVNPRRPAIIITNDGDGHYQAWKYTGNAKDAAATLACLEMRVGDGKISVFNGYGYDIEDAPEDFWIGQNPDEDGDFMNYVPNLAKYPNVIAY